MMLLKLDAFSVRRISINDLHSTMMLLKHSNYVNGSAGIYLFTFHYDAIKTKMKKEIKELYREIYIPL